MQRKPETTRVLWLHLLASSLFLLLLLLLLLLLFETS